MTKQDPLSYLKKKKKWKGKPHSGRRSLQHVNEKGLIPEHKIISKSIQKHYRKMNKTDASQNKDI